MALIIEDDDDLCVIFEQALKSAMFEAEVIRNGDLAAQRLEREVPDLIVLDLHLPGLSGSHLLRRIRADARFSRTPVIVASADPRMAESLQEVADLVLIKPVSYKQLRDLASRFRSIHQRLASTAV